MRMKLYHFFVNSHAGIRCRYHRVHDNRGTGGRLLSYLYLMWLNFCYYILQCRFLDREKDMAFYESKRLPVRTSESEARQNKGPYVDEAVKRLLQYDVISFDIFDTLLLRPFSEPSDLFYFIGAQLGLLDIKRIRMEQEEAARRLCERARGNREADLAQIWAQMEQAMGIPAEQGMKLELSLEKTFCYANPFLLQVFEKLRERGKRIVAISDMYLPSAFLAELLREKGFAGIEAVYVSCEHGCGKGDGGLFRIVKAGLPAGAKLVHVGDNPVSDVKMAEKNGFHTLYYPNVNQMALCFRPYDMSPVIGGAYRGIVDNHLYAGLCAYSREYEYGFVYGGLFVLGYCGFIHRYCLSHQVGKILFLSRDGDILKQVYERVYPQECTAEYVYWSRTAATKLMAGHDRYDYFRRFLYHKVNQGFTIGTILEEMELGSLAEQLPFWQSERLSGLGRLDARAVLTDHNVDELKEFLKGHFGEIRESYREQEEAARQYFSQILSGTERAVAVDVGWAGSGAMALRYLVEKVWRLPCKITGIVAGTNTLHNAEPEASEIFLQMGVLKAYLFAQAQNRDVLKKHDPNRGYNVFWELLLASPTRPFSGFGFDKNGGVTLHFGKEEENLEGVREIQRGILDFVESYLTHFGKFPYLLEISGRDACAPMLLASAHQERYLREIQSKFDLKIGIGTGEGKGETP